VLADSECSLVSDVQTVSIQHIKSNHPIYQIKNRSTWYCGVKNNSLDDVFLRLLPPALFLLAGFELSRLLLLLKPNGDDTRAAPRALRLQTAIHLTLDLLGLQAQLPRLKDRKDCDVELLLDVVDMISMMSHAFSYKIVVESWSIMNENDLLSTWDSG
jgi:hypothetical protein